MSRESKAGAWNSADLDWLTGVRFFAALWVVFHHVGGAAGGGHPYLTRLNAAGWLGVKLFFILSGFILTHVYGAKPAIPYRSFLLARAARILPMHFFALLVAVPHLIAGFREHIAHHGAAVGVAVASGKAFLVVTLLQAWFPSGALFWNGVSWSLSAELLFYLLFPVLVVRLRNRSTAVLVGLLVAMVGLELLRNFGNRELPSVAWSFVPALRVSDFVTGILIRLLMTRGLRLPGWSAIPIVALLLGTQLVAGMPWGLGVILNHLLASGAILALAIPRQGVRSKPMLGLILLGQASYAMYLLHHPLETWKNLVLPAGSVSFGWYLLGVVAVSIAAFVWLEDPCRKWIRNRFG